MSRAWLLLVLAGLFECGWAVGLKYAEGFTRPVPSALTVIGAAASFFLLSLAMRSLPVATAYAVWVGIGTVGTAVLAATLFGEALTPMRLAGIGLIVAGVGALRLA